MILLIIACVVSGYIISRPIVRAVHAVMGE